MLANFFKTAKPQPHSQPKTTFESVQVPDQDMEAASEQQATTAVEQNVEDNVLSNGNADSPVHADIVIEQPDSNDDLAQIPNTQITSEPMHVDSDHVSATALSEDINHDSCMDAGRVHSSPDITPLWNDWAIFSDDDNQPNDHHGIFAEPQSVGDTSRHLERSPARADQDESEVSALTAPVSPGNQPLAATATTTTGYAAPTSSSEFVDLPTLPIRSQTASPKCGSHYTSLANWPPPEPASCDNAQRLDIYPPKDAPLHVWVQAYALRWGTWTADIKDEAVRERVLSAVTEKMKEAWVTAITEGYYARPTIDEHQHDSDGQTKPGRKRAISPSKQGAGFVVIDGGKDKLAITNAELAEHSLTIDVINERVKSRDFEAGELRFNEVLEVLGSRDIVITDWSATRYPTIQGRNLLMYALFVVQDTRTNLRRMQNLLEKFTKEVQKKNTLARIETYQERELQHLALATELALQERSRSNSDGSGYANDAGTVDLTSEVDEDASEEVDLVQDLGSEACAAAKHLLIELAQDVLQAESEVNVQRAFTSRDLQLATFSEEGLKVDNNEGLQTAKALLGQILQHTSHLITTKQRVKNQHPNEIIRIGHDIRLTKQKISNLQQKLHVCLSKDLHVSNVTYLSDHDRTAATQDNIDPQCPSLPSSSLSTVGDALHDTEKQSSPAPVSMPTRTPNRSTIQSASARDSFRPSNEQAGNKPAQYHSQISPGMSHTTTSPYSQVVANQSGVPQQVAPPTGSGTASDPSRLNHIEATLKREYINQVWLPFLNHTLMQQGKQPVQGSLDSWRQIKELLSGLGFSAEERNNLLGSFKARFAQYCEQRGIHVTDGTKAQSSTSTATTAASPIPSYASTSHQPSTSWPSDAEILAAIPQRGIPASQLLQAFAPRLNQKQSQFMETIKRLCVYDPSNYMVYPKQTLPPANRKYNTLPPSGHSSQATLPSPKPERPGLVKIKLPPQHSSNFAGLPAQDESDFPDDMKSEEVNESRGFSFRHLPHATFEQRQRMDEEIGEYISKMCKSRTKRHYGQYTIFTDPDDPSGPPVAHGFWDLRDGSKLSGTEWFYNGEDMPEGWNAYGNDGDAGDAQVQQSSTPATPAPRLTLKVGAPGDSVPTTPQSGRRGAQAEPTFDSYNNQQQHFKSIPPPSLYNIRGRTRHMQGQAQPQQYNSTNTNTNANTINPAHLFTSSIDPFAEFTTQDEDHEAEIGTGQANKRAGKRTASNSGGGRRKKRRTGDADDADYDPNQD
ncbi:hypothetical protein LTR64_004469 [Lithohypha guttulata]|uniref:uncharacterized protein n=1 Tax=Lithohypha guttulata TaxID=1690604 RepID=UPI002DDFCE29|nr:hypothetical protein LTR51_006235 [Lithohypha guttulata]